MPSERIIIFCQNSQKLKRINHGLIKPRTRHKILIIRIKQQRFRVFLNSHGLEFIALVGFGMTELCGASHNIAPDRKTKSGSVGVLLPNLECKVSNRCLTIKVACDKLSNIPLHEKATTKSGVLNINPLLSLLNYLKLLLLLLLITLLIKKIS